MVRRTRDAEAELNLPPGFRFHPTDEELVVHYLSRKASKQFLPVPIIAEVDLYKYDPWWLPEKALFGQKEWYFFTPRDRKYPNGSRPNRAAGSGYWKATGADKPVTPAGHAKPLGIKKALVFYTGKAPRGVKTNWIMHEYRLADTTGRSAATKKGSLRLDDWVLCRLYNKKNNWEKELQQQQQQMELQQTEEVSFQETSDSFEAADEGPSDSHRSPESGIDNEMYAQEGSLLDMESNAMVPVDNRDNNIHSSRSDWYMDLKLDDLQNSFATFEAGPPSLGGLGSYPELYFNSLSSPLPTPRTTGIQSGIPPL